MEESMVYEPPLLDKEEWRPVVGFEDTFHVSNHGRVKRVRDARTDYYVKLMPRHVSSGGYYVMNLTRHNKHATRFVHVLVAAAFLGPKPSGQVVNHIDANRLNPHLSNLEYVTARENS